ncbi:MAG: dienelactone hydrolase family protein [Candidatus Obscuribacterales bacterium]|nr:dienelactone hydrolase family protein [Candidatus Obscuribacterales bacterium]
MSNEISRSTLSYQFQGKNYEGQLFANEAAGRLPGVFIVHTWLGIDQSILKRAERVAELGYAAYVVDLFGPGVLPQPPVDSMQAILPFIKDRQHFRNALGAGLDAFRTSSLVNGSKIAAIGYCFGGCGVLEMARAGLVLEGVVSLHGELNTTLPAKSGDVKARVLVLHGDADIVVKQESVAEFLDEMRACEADWEFTSYSSAKHSFTGEGAAGKSTPEAGINDLAEARSWASMSTFLNSVLNT